MNSNNNSNYNSNRRGCTGRFCKKLGNKARNLSKKISNWMGPKQTKQLRIEVPNNYKRHTNTLYSVTNKTGRKRINKLGNFNRPESPELPPSMLYGHWAGHGHGGWYLNEDPMGKKKTRKLRK